MGEDKAQAQVEATDKTMTLSSSHGPVYHDMFYMFYTGKPGDGLESCGSRNTPTAAAQATAAVRAFSALRTALPAPNDWRPLRSI